MGETHRTEKAPNASNLDRGVARSLISISGHRAALYRAVYDGSMELEEGEGGTRFYERARKARCVNDVFFGVPRQCLLFMAETVTRCPQSFLSASVTTASLTLCLPPIRVALTAKPSSCWGGGGGGGGVGRGGGGGGSRPRASTEPGAHVLQAKVFGSCHRNANECTA